LAGSRWAMGMNGLSRGEQKAYRALLVLLAVYAVTIPFKTYNLVNLAGLAAAVCAGFLVRGNLRRTDSRRACRLMLIALATLAASSLVSTLLSVTLDNALTRGARPEFALVLGAAVVFALGFGLRDAVWVPRLLWLMLAAYGVFLLIDVALAPWSSASWEHGRFIGLRHSPTAYSKELLQLAALYLGAALVMRKRRSAVLWLSGALLATVLLLLTGTRFVLLTLLLVTLPAALLVATSSLSRRRRWWVLAVWLVVVVPLLGYGWYRMNPERRSMASATSRLEHWKLTGEITRRAPRYKWIIGHGPSKRVSPLAA
jgi:hypothetical protein